MKNEVFPPLSRQGVEFHVDRNKNITLEENQAPCRTLIDQVSPLSEEVHLQMGEQQFILDLASQSIQESRLICVQSDPDKQQELIAQVKAFVSSPFL